MASFYTPWKNQKTFGFLMFSGDIERDQWHEMGYCLFNKMQILCFFNFHVKWIIPLALVRHFEFENIKIWLK